MPNCNAVCGVMPNCAKTGMPAREMARTASGKSAAPSSLTMSTPASLTKRMAASSAACVPCCNGPKGKSTLSSARLTPRRTALVTISISSMLTCNGLAWPSKCTPTVSPTETMSTPARSTTCAICQSHATTPTILRPSRFICCRAGMVTGLVSMLSPAAISIFTPRVAVCSQQTIHPPWAAER